LYYLEIDSLEALSDFDFFTFSRRCGARQKTEASETHHKIRVEEKHGYVITR